MTDQVRGPVVRPALETLRELEGRKFLDRLAIQINEATKAVEHYRKPAKIVITMDISILTNEGISEAAVAIKAEITSKLPKAEASKSIFFVDKDGNPTKNMTRQEDLDLHVAPRADAQEKQA